MLCILRVIVCKSCRDRLRRRLCVEWRQSLASDENDFVPCCGRMLYAREKRFGSRSIRQGWRPEAGAVRDYVPQR